MDSDRPANFGKSVDVKASNRPIKIAYVVPRDETSGNHMIVDAVFHESYTRWAGAYTLIVPAGPKEFLHSEYGSWLAFFDPDFVYTYLELEPSLVETIDGSCSPIAFLRHTIRGGDLDDLRWQRFIPDWGLYFAAVSSVTTVPSPHTQPAFFMKREPEGEVTIATQYDEGIKSRLLKDNFGSAFHTHVVTHGIPGLYRTLCLVPPDLPENHIVGTERCTSMTDMLSAISIRKAHPIAKFALAHSEAIPRVEPYLWAHSFNLFIGSTVLDRIHFWNARHFTPGYAASFGSLILEAEFFNDAKSVTQLGEYLNKNNFLGQNNSPANVTIRSYSHNEEELLSVRDKLRKHTYNSVFLGKPFSVPALPEEKELAKSYSKAPTYTSTFKITEDSNSLTAKEPSHFAYLPPRYKELTKGQWIVELDIQRHNNLSKYSNIIDTWVLPQRRKATRAFTNKLGKVTSGHRLAIVPATEGFPFSSGSINREYLYDLSLPDDAVFFRYLLLDSFKYPQDDVRASLIKVSYQDLAISDKGQNLRGVISMFDNLSDAYQVLTNKYWREVLRAAKEDSAKYLVFTREQLEGYLPNDRPAKEKLMAELRLGDVGKVTQFMRCNLTDTLEHLIRANVFFCVHQWRCRYCGHRNSRNFDSMKIKNSCEICATAYFAPVDLEWTYQLNEFVFRSLVKHTGLPVLWTLGFLQDRSGPVSFWYLPEVDLYESYGVQDKKNEIDILCVCGGKFVAVEVKLSASQFINKLEASDSFVKKINIIQPDIAILSFERYCDSEENVEAVKTSLRQTFADLQRGLRNSIKLEIIVATDVQGFSDHPHDLGWFGRRTDGIH